MQQSIPKHQLLLQIQQLIALLKKPQHYKDNILLYNDLLLLRLTIPNIPQSYNQVLSNEFHSIKQRIQKKGKGGLWGIGNYIWSKDPISLEKITNHLKTVEKKGVVLEDFLICCEGKKRQLKVEEK